MITNVELREVGGWAAGGDGAGSHSSMEVDILASP